MPFPTLSELMLSTHADARLENRYLNPEDFRLARGAYGGIDVNEVNSLICDKINDELEIRYRYLGRRDVTIPTNTVKGISILKPIITGLDGLPYTIDLHVLTNGKGNRRDNSNAWAISVVADDRAPDGIITTLMAAPSDSEKLKQVVQNSTTAAKPPRSLPVEVLDVETLTNGRFRASFPIDLEDLLSHITENINELHRSQEDVNYKAIMDYYDASTDKPAAAAEVMGVPPRRLGGVELRAQVSDFVLDLSYEETKEVLDILGVDPHAELDESLMLESKKELMKKQYVDTGKLSEKELDHLLGDDPISDKFAIWLCNRYYKTIKEPYLVKTPTGEQAISREGAPIIKRFFEDIEALRTDLSTFSRYKNKFTHNDIMKYPDFKSFQDEAIKVADSLTLADKEKGKEKKEKYAELKIGEVDGFTVYVIPQNRPDLKDAAIELGSGTRWCTAGSTNNYFTTYNRTDTMFVFVRGQEKYQFHFRDKQFMDKNDQQVPDGEFKTRLLDFVREKAGRLTGKEDMNQYKVGTFETPNGELPLYKVGTKFYTELGRKKIFYDTDTKVFKDISGSTMSTSQLFKADTIPFLRAVYAGMKQEGSTKGFPAIYRLLLNLDVPEKGPDHWWEVPTGLGLRGSDLTSLPENLWIHGDLDVRESQIKTLPKRLKVDGNIKQ
jgi:hypothetical protein